MALVIRNRQRISRVNTRLLRTITKTALEELLGVENYELGIHLVAAPEMTHLNETFLKHAGPTDVITFDYVDRAIASPSPVGRERAGVRARSLLHGEIFICLDEALAQARRFRTTWQSEIVRYAIHGLLHLLGHDDLKPAARRTMKREEDRLHRLLAERFSFGKLGA